jgi:subtilisin family serine protease
VGEKRYGRLVRWIAALLGVAVLAGLPASAAAEDLIVRYAPGATAVQRASALDAAGVERRARLTPGRVDVVALRGGTVARAAGSVAARLEAQPAVLSAEPDVTIRRTATPTDRWFGEQYALPLTGTPAAWDLTTGTADVTVAVVDSGADLHHPDLRPNLRRNPRERGGNRRDDDGNGYVDDVFGYDFQARDGTPQDRDGHGSHVAGIVGAQGNDREGVAGVAWTASLMPLRVLGADGAGRLSDAIRAYAYAAKEGARIVNVSWGGSEFIQAEYDAIAAAPNVLFVAAAGNDGQDVDATPSYPCAHDLPNVICVGASDQNDQLAVWSPTKASNRGATSVDLAAPGVGIASTVTNGDWALDDGTSMAAPHVAGAAALMLSRAPRATAAQLKATLLGSVAVRPGLQGVTATGGRLDIAGAVRGICAVPGLACRARGKLRAIQRAATRR